MTRYVIGSRRLDGCIQQHVVETNQSIEWIRNFAVAEFGPEVTVVLVGMDGGKVIEDQPTPPDFKPRPPLKSA